MVRFRWVGIRTMTILISSAMFAITMGPVTAQDNPISTANEGALVAILQGNGPKEDKALACKRLAIVGTDKAVGALAALIPDAELCSWARIPLEAIPGQAASDALREAMGNVSGNILVGVINSIGVRRDVEAIPALTVRLGDADTEVAAAAAVALGNMGNGTVADILRAAVGHASMPVRSAIAEGCVLCAEQLIAAGQAEEAVELYSAVLQAEVPKIRRLEATRGLILAKGSGGLPLLVEQLHSTDKAFYALGLTTARELAGNAVTEGLAAELLKLPPDRQAMLIQAIADRTDSAVMPAVLRAATDGPTHVRLMALQSLPKVGDGTCVAPLLDAAAKSDPAVVQAVKEGLATIAGDDVNAILTSRLAQATGPMRQMLIELAGLRRIHAATPAIFAAMEKGDPQTFAAGITALGSTVEQQDLPKLIGYVFGKSTGKVETPSADALDALRAACVRMPDLDACADQLTMVMKGANTRTKCSVVEILGAMGGSQALRAVADAAKEKNPELQDTASRLLGEWMTVDAAPMLLDLAKTSSETKYHVRALRGFLRIARQFVLPDEQRVAMCRDALAVAKRNEEKELVLEVLERYPGIESLQTAVDLAKTPSLKDAATKTSLAIAQKMGASDDAKRLLLNLGFRPGKLEIVKAEYGADTKFKDVSDVVRQHARDLPLVMLPKGYNDMFGGDPVPGVSKQLKIEYKLDGKAGQASFPENGVILLPAPK